MGGAACPVVGGGAILSGVTSTTTGSFVGRAEELDHLVALLGRAERGRPAVGLIAGDAGVGKTRLLDELAARAEGRGVRVLVGGCMEVGDVWPPVRALRGRLPRPRRPDRARPRWPPCWPRPCPAWAGSCPSRSPARPAPWDGFERVQLFDGCCRRWSACPSWPRCCW